MSTLLLLKLFLAPTFVALVTGIQSRWGDGIGGKLIGLPLTTGPFIYIIYQQEGRSFAGQAAHGVLVGQISLIIYTWSYAKAATKLDGIPALSVGTAACIASGLALTSFSIALTPLLIALLLFWLLATKFWPKFPEVAHTTSPPRWELPVRMAVTVFLILILSGSASVLGPRLAGALSTYPVIASVLGVFNHKRFGPGATIATLKGLVATLPLTIVLMASLAIVL
ncbi:MAG: hypothetical protein NT152_03375 [Actinobacteria bacterium]|nr:hypothetical protein [Actinomycetota bacterium]